MKRKEGGKKLGCLIPIVVVIVLFIVFLLIPTGSSETHIYDKAEIHDVVNGSRTEKIGEYSIIKIDSASVTDDALSDWYFNYVEKNDYNWCMILYSDKNDNSGVYANNSYVEKDVVFDEDEYGDYMLGDSSGSTIFYPKDDGTLEAFDQNK